MMRLIGEARLRREIPVLALAAVAVGGLAGAVSATGAGLAVAVMAGVALIGLTAHRPVALAVIALMGVFASQRLGSTVVSGNRPGITYSDALLCAAALMSVPALLRTRELSRLRAAGWGVAVYLACLLPTVFLNSSERGYLEWLHRLALLGGSLLVGAWIAREGKIRPALRWLVFVAGIVAVATVSRAVTVGWGSSAPFGLNKNFVGGLLGAVIVVAVIAREDLDLPASWWTVVVGVLGAGEIASHSRGGAMAASVGLFLAFMRQARLRRGGAKVLAVLVAVGLALFVYVSVRGQLNRSESWKDTSPIGFRFNVERVTRDVWRTSPIYGVGLKYFDTHNYGRFGVAADNDIDNELAESGVVGLVGFVVLQGAMISAGFRRGRREQLAAAGYGAVAGLLAHGMVDIYWTAGTASLPFLIMGMALARDPSDQVRQPAAHDRLTPHREISMDETGYLDDEFSEPLEATRQHRPAH